MTDRIERMRECEEYACPDWCTQDDAEAEHEQHISQPVELTTNDGDVITARAHLGWGENGDDHVVIQLTTVDGSNELWLTPDDANAVNDLLSDAQDLLSDTYTEVEAWPGANDEADEDDGEG